jgi:DivIVA domain-containing protein
MLMPSTPADIQNVVFGRAAAGRRGFDADEVDAFVLAVGDELAFLVEENSRLRALLDGVDEHAATASAEQLTVLRGQLAQALRDRTAAEQVALALRAELDQAHRQPAPAPAAGGGGGQVGRVLAVAQRTAEACVTDAEREADDLLSEARATVQKITQHAQTRPCSWSRTPAPVTGRRWPRSTPNAPPCNGASNSSRNSNAITTPV